jgi:hypothetical protein
MGKVAIMETAVLLAIISGSVTIVVAGAALVTSVAGGIVSICTIAFVYKKSKSETKNEDKNDTTFNIKNKVETIETKLDGTSITKKREQEIDVKNANSSLAQAMISNTEVKGNTGGENKVAEGLAKGGTGALKTIAGGLNGGAEEEVSGGLLKVVVDKGKNLLSKKEDKVIVNEETEEVIKLENEEIKKENLEQFKEPELRKNVLIDNENNRKEVVVDIVKNASNILEDGLIDQNETEELAKKVLGENEIGNLIGDLVVINIEGQ